MATFSDDFNRANGTLGANWASAISTRNFTIATNVAKNASGSTAVDLWATPCTTDNNKSYVSLASAVGLNMGVVARWQSLSQTTTNHNGYLWKSISTGFQIQKCVAGTYTSLGSEYTANAVNGDIIGIECSGSTISGYVNGTLRSQLTDTSVTTGNYVGMRGGTSTSATYDNWSGGDLDPLSFSDNFNRANESPVTGWYVVSGTPEIFSNQLRTTEGAVSTEALFDSACTTDNNFAQVTAATYGSGQFVGVVARATRSTTLNGYLWRLASDVNQIQILKQVAGTQTVLGSPYSVGPVAGQILRIEASGSTITGYLDAVQRQQVTDTSVTAGRYTGVRYAGLGTTALDNFSSGDITAKWRDTQLWRSSLTWRGAVGSGPPAFAIQGAVHSHTADNVDLVQHHVLVIQDATHSHTADNVTLTQHQILVIQDAAHTHTAESLDLVQHYAALVVQNATHAHSAENITLTQHQVLVIQDATHVHTADEVILSVTGLWALWTGTELVKLTVEGVWNGSSIEPLTAWTGELV